MHLPAFATSSISTPNVYAKFPNTEKMVKPANKLVNVSIPLMIQASLYTLCLKGL